MNPKEEVKKSLEALENSPIVEEDFYYVHLDNLCGVAARLIGDVLGKIEGMEHDVKKNVFNSLGTDLNSLRYQLFEIDTIVEVIKEKSNHKDFNKLCDLVYFLREMDIETVSNKDEDGVSPVTVRIRN